MPLTTNDPDITKEKGTTEQTVTLLLMRLNQSLAELDALSQFPQSDKPHVRNLYRNVFKDIYELSRLVRATLSPKLLKNLNDWRVIPQDTNFIKNAIVLTEQIYDELSESGMIDIRVRKTATFPIEFYTSKFIQFD